MLNKTYVVIVHFNCIFISVPNEKKIIICGPSAILIKSMKSIMKNRMTPPCKILRIECSKNLTSMSFGPGQKPRIFILKGTQVKPSWKAKKL